MSDAMNAHLKANLKKANNTGTWEQTLRNKDRKLLAQIKNIDANMVSGRRLGQEYNFNPVANANKFHTLKKLGCIEKFNKKQWQLTEKGENWEP